MSNCVTRWTIPSLLSASKGWELPQEVYYELRNAVLARDGWNCKIIGGTRSNLEAHHIQFRSRGGENCEENLISVCTNCYKTVHANG